MRLTRESRSLAEGAQHDEVIVLGHVADSAGVRPVDKVI